MCRGETSGGPGREYESGALPCTPASTVLLEEVCAKERIAKFLEDRGAAVPAEHNYGRIYPAPSRMAEHFQQLDPLNMFNVGVIREVERHAQLEGGGSSTEE